MARPTGRPVRDELIDAATEMIQRGGVNGFSYGDLAKHLNIKAPSIHHHFRTKEDLVAVVAEKYRQEFSVLVEELSADTASKQIQEYAELFRGTASSDRLCLCGALAADWISVGPAPQTQVEGFFSDQVEWLSARFGEAIEAGELRADLDKDKLARTLFAALEGSMLMSRSGDAHDLASQVTRAFLSLARPTKK